MAKLKKQRLTPEQEKKRGNAVKLIGWILLVLFLVGTVLSLVFYDQIDAFVEQYRPIENAEGVLEYPLGAGLLTRLILLIPNLIRTVQVIFIVLLVLHLLKFIVRGIFKGTPKRVTVGKLVWSISKAVVWIIGVLVIFAVWGMNVGAIVASAGVLTLIIGLGMQSLISDVVAGIFLVTDGMLQVGDIVTIDGWRGTVQEIGLRNTTLINIGGDIRVANNSTIKIFVNQSRVTSFALARIGLAYGEDIKHVEEVFEANRDAIKASIPMLLDLPEYKGVEMLDHSSVNLLFGGSCKEEDIAQVQRDLTRALKIMFDENNIQIPFPQVDVHMPDEKKKK